MTDNKLIDKLQNKNIPVFNVSEITTEISDLLETKYNYVKIKGEISNSSGTKYPHVYLSLKDKDNVINAKIWKNKIPYLKIFPKDGLEVICSGRIRVWSKNNSEFYLDIDSISLEGEGQLLKMKEELRKKLEIEGLFDEKYKKRIPLIPNKIGIITSPAGSVIKDMQRIIFERFSLPIELYPVTVQGEKAVKDIIKAIKYFNNRVVDKIQADILIIARGGGSIEDLWCFNNEDLVRAVFNSKIPIISAIGHEPDVNIIDYVADISLATPSHAAKTVVPERKDLLLKVDNNFKSFKKGFLNFFNNKKKNLELIFSNLHSPYELFKFKKESFSRIVNDFFISDKKFLSSIDEKVKSIIGKFNIGSHKNTLKRGYTYIKNLKNNSFIKSSKTISPNTDLSINFYDGNIKAISKKKK